MIEAAAIVSATINHWDDFAIIIALLLCNENKQLGERTKNTSPSIDEGMNLVFLLLFCLNLSL
ncbi:hypothetical protein [Lactobacillus helveticus]|uniref:Uncharacterized protein n=1 Tax=Lactobacillus helveticus TaxID=1587 RepID=A0A6A7JYW2_LACHE|nr:hypothetical protein [Lactobacillus helveticus]MPW13533.1 hypothetical protein [Lactobacillus helveticus]